MKARTRVALCGVIAVISSIAVIAGVDANPLAEHRRSIREPSTRAYEISGSVASAGADGRIVLSMPSARLVNGGVRSGDQVTIEMGKRSWSAQVAFRDEMERPVPHEPQAEGQAPPEPGMVLVVNRDRPGDRIVLDASTGGVSPNEVAEGQAVSIRAIRRKAKE
jgi:hypothetical protein